MICRKCGATIPDGSLFCNLCGIRQSGSTPKRTTEPAAPKQRHRVRGNGQGTVYKKADGKYIARVVLSVYTDDDGKLHRRTVSETFAKKSDAVAALPTLRERGTKNKPRVRYTFAQLYKLWLADYDRLGRSKSTRDCYTSTYKYFAAYHDTPMDDIEVDDLQECIDDCGHGRRTRENARAMLGLVYKYAIPRHLIDDAINLAAYLHVDGEHAAERSSFDDIQIERIKKAAASDDDAAAVYCMIYLGFRPSEFLSLRVEDYDSKRSAFVGGAKTAAGKGRTVPVSPKIAPFIAARIAGRAEGYVFAANGGEKWGLKKFTEEIFYPGVAAAGIDNPIVEIAGGVKRHKYTPHSCRHTFATLMKRVGGSSKDKQSLIGHASEEQLKYYQDVTIDDLRGIIDEL